MKKKIIAVACVIITLAMSVSLVSCSSKKYVDKVVDDSQLVTDADGITYIYDENGETKPYDPSNNKPLDKSSTGNHHYDVGDEKQNAVQGNTVATAEDEATKKNTVTKPISTTIPNGTTKKGESTTKASTTKKQTTTKATTKKPTTTYPAMTTTSPGGVIELPDIPIDEDENPLTPSLAMYLMQERYDKKKYVVNLAKESTDNQAILYIYTLKDKKIYSTAKVNLKNGKTVENIIDKKEKKEYVLEF